MIPKWNKEPILGFGFDALTASKTSEAGEDESGRSFPIEKAGEPERSASSVLNAGDGVPVAGDVEVFRRSVFRIVDDADGFVFEIEMRNGNEFGGELFELGVVVAQNEGEGNFDLGDECLEDFREFRGDAAGGVEKIASDDEMLGVMIADKVLDPGEIPAGVAFWDGEAAGAEGGGFS